MISEHDRNILRELGKRKAEIAALPVQNERRRLWTRLNDLDSVRPMVWIFEVPWHEMNVDDELTLSCEGDFGRDLELALRRELYQWNHMPGDMVIAPAMEVGPAVRCPEVDCRSLSRMALSMMSFPRHLSFPRRRESIIVGCGPLPSQG